VSFSFSDIAGALLLYKRGISIENYCCSTQWQYTGCLSSDVLAFFIPPCAVLPLLQPEYLRPQGPGKPLCMYVMDIKEMAAISHQDMDEAVVVHTILDGLHP
jgi:hypothetical protein